MDDRFLSIALDHIRKRRCVLFLGPRFGMDADGNKLHERLRAFLESEKIPGTDQPKFSLVDEFDNLFVLSDPKTGNTHKLDMHHRMQNFYKSEVQPHSIYRRLPRIPFSVILTCTHDLLLDEAFREEEIPVSFQSYQQRKMPDDDGKPILPFIYNVFGRVDDKESLVDTYNTFSNFIIKVLSGEALLSRNLKYALANANMFIFLGFDLEAWYYPLVLRKLHTLVGEAKEVSAYVSHDWSVGPRYSDISPEEEQKVRKSVSNRAERMYAPIDLAFWEKDTLDVLDSIYEALEKEGELRQKPTLAARMRNLLEKGEFENVFAMLKKAFAEFLSDELDEVDLLISRFARFQRQKHSGEISPEEEGTEFEKIREAVNFRINRIEKLSS